MHSTKVTDVAGGGNSGELLNWGTKLRMREAEAAVTTAALCPIGDKTGIKLEAGNSRSESRIGDRTGPWQVGLKNNYKEIENITRISTSEQQDDNRDITQEGANKRNERRPYGNSKKEL